MPGSDRGPYADEACRRKNLLSPARPVLRDHRQPRADRPIPTRRCRFIQVGRPILIPDSRAARRPVCRPIPLRWSRAPEKSRTRTLRRKNPRARIPRIRRSPANLRRSSPIPQVPTRSPSIRGSSDFGQIRSTREQGHADRAAAAKGRQAARCGHSGERSQKGIFSTQASGYGPCVGVFVEAVA